MTFKERWAKDFKEWAIRQQQERAEAQRICDRIQSGNVKCKCGGKAKIQILPAGGCSMRQNVRIYCSRTRCCRSSNWHDDHNMITAWGEWEEQQKRK